MPSQIEDVDDLLAVLADLYASAADSHWHEADVLAEACRPDLYGREAVEAVSRDHFLSHLRELFA